MTLSGFVSNVTSLLGVGVITAQKMVDYGIKSFNDVADMVVEDFAKAAKRPANELAIAKTIAQKLPSKFIENATAAQLPIAQKVWGVGIETAIYLYAIGIRLPEDIVFLKPIILPINLPIRLRIRIEKLKPQILLSLILGLSSWRARILALAGYTSVVDLAGAKPSMIARILPGISIGQASTWIELAKKLVKANILDYRTASKLPLAKEIGGIGPEFAAVLHVSDIQDHRSLAIDLDTDLRDKYFPWVSKRTMLSWVRQAFEHWQPKGWTAGITSLTLMTNSQLSRRTGAIESTVEKSALVDEPEGSDDIPEKWNNKVWATSVKNQGDCGACIAFASLAVLESLQRMYKGRSKPDLSEAHLFHSWGGGKCEGGWNLDEAMKFLIKYGVIYETDYKYKDTKDNFVVTDEMMKCAKENRVLAYRHTKTRSVMKYWIRYHGPLIAHMSTYMDIHSFKKGIYERSKPYEKPGSHLVAVYGYSDLKDAWLCKNSWGEDWGEKGWFWIRYGECNIDDKMWKLEI